jgi:hypothetical protein
MTRSGMRGKRLGEAIERSEKIWSIRSDDRIENQCMLILFIVTSTCGIPPSSSQVTDEETRKS